MSAAGHVEKARLAAVGVAHEDGIYLLALLPRHTVEDVLTAVCHHSLEGGVSCFPLFGFLLTHHLYEVCLCLAQAHLIVHYLICHRVAQRSVEHHLHCLPLDESHLDDSLAKTAVAHDAHDDARLACR